MGVYKGLQEGSRIVFNTRGGRGGEARMFDRDWKPVAWSGGTIVLREPRLDDEQAVRDYVDFLARATGFRVIEETELPEDTWGKLAFRFY